MKGQVILLFVLIGYVCCESILSDIVYKSVQASEKRIKRHSVHGVDSSIRLAFNMADSNHDSRVTVDEMVNFVKLTTGMNLDDEARGYMRMGIRAISGGQDSIDFQQFNMMYRAGLKSNGFTG